MASGNDEPGFYKWLVLLASFMLQFFTSSVMSAVGVFYIIFIQNLGSSSSLISLASSVSTAVTFAIGPIVGCMINKYGCRIVSIIGSIIATLGLCLTAFVTSPWHLVLTFGIFAGLGLGTIYSASMVAVGQNFTKRRPLAIGIAVTGIGIGPIISPPILVALEKHFGWRGAILLFSGIFLHSVLFSTLLRPVKIVSACKDYSKDSNYSAQYENQSQDQKGPHQREASECGKSSRMLLTNIPFVINLLQTTIFSAGLCIIQVHVGAFAVSLGYPTDQAAMLIFSMGIGSACSRIIFGILLQLSALDPIKVYMATSIILGLLTIAYPFGNSYVSLVAVAGTIGFFAASYGNLPPLIAIKLVGIQHFAISYGYVGFAGAIGYILDGPVSGWIYETTKNYPVLFFLAGGIIIVSVVTLILISILLQRQHHPPGYLGEDKTIQGPAL